MKLRHSRNDNAPIVPRTVGISDSTIRAITEQEHRKERAARTRGAAAARRTDARKAPGGAETPQSGVPRHRSGSTGAPGTGTAVGKPRLRLHRHTAADDVLAYLRQMQRYLKARLSSINLEKEFVFRVLITAALVVVSAALETTLAARFPLFGQTPDLMLSLVIAVAMTEKEKFGAVTGLLAGLVIDAVGQTGGLSLSAILYMLVGYLAGVLTENYFTGRWPVRVIYTLAAGLPRALLTVIVLRNGDTVASTMTAGQMFLDVLIPGYFSTAVAAVFPHLAAWLTLRSFHKTRDERIR